MLRDAAAARVTQLFRSRIVRAWLVSRTIVLAALLTSHLVHFSERGSLLSWDGAWYRDIAVHGYLDAPEGAVRFFPLWPLLARWTGLLPGASPELMLVLIANVAAFAYLALARRVALEEGAGPAVADRMPAVLALAPAGTVLVMGYTEPLFGVLLCVVLLTMRRGRWLACAAAGLAIGPLRPTGVVVCLPIAIEAYRGFTSAAPGNKAARLTAVCAPVVGLAAYLGWTWNAYGDALAPFRAQLDPALRGATFVDPLITVAAIPVLFSNREIVGMILNLLFIVVSIALLAVSARRLPLSYTAFAAATLFLAITARNFSSFERYACSALPLLLAAAMVFSERPRLRRWAAILAPIVLFGQSVLIFGGWYLP